MMGRGRDKSGERMKEGWMEERKKKGKVKGIIKVSDLCMVNSYMELKILNRKEMYKSIFSY